MPADVETQCANTLAKIERALGEAGAGFSDVVKASYILPVAADFAPCWPMLRAAFEAARPAATMIVAGLIDPAMRIEIEVTARVNEAAA
jgi:enamine deaminase RidA (YjgF/YER057c/UK114 family)